MAAGWHKLESRSHLGVPSQVSAFPAKDRQSGGVKSSRMRKLYHAGWFPTSGASSLSTRLCTERSRRLSARFLNKSSYDYIVNKRSCGRRGLSSSFDSPSRAKSLSLVTNKVPMETTLPGLKSGGGKVFTNSCHHPLMFHRCEESPRN